MVKSQWLTTQLFLYKHDHYYNMIDDENMCDFYNAYLFLLKYVKLACTLRTDVSFVQDSPCKYYLQIAIFMCLHWHVFHAKCLFSTLNLWDHKQVMKNSTWVVYAHPRLDIVLGCVLSMVERLSLILSTKVSMLITYLNM